LGVVCDAHAEMILADVDRYLAGDHGIRRYLGDSYWAPDYDDHLSVADRTRDFSDDLSSRDELLDSIGHEAQWCIFDPMLSAYYGRRYRATAAVGDRERQVYHFERSLAQVTPQWTCPELYYRKRGTYTPNPHTPLLWTQANLAVAVHEMRQNAGVP
jgi:phosphorylase kinase alpha/beta subunit